MHTHLSSLLTVCWLACSGLLATHANAAPAEMPAADQAIDVIAIGSCARQDKPMPGWDVIAAHEPDVFLFLGDNMYADLERKRREITPIDVAKAYVELAGHDTFERFRRAVPILATWDDHDYGLNDAGKELPFKAASERLMLQFFREPMDSPRWDRPGVYGSWQFGPEGRRVQVILLDTRMFREGLERNPKGRIGGGGPYMPTEDESRTLLGEAQWQWLEGELRKPANVRLIGSSIQVVAREHGWETWGNFPHERQRLYELIGETGADGVIFVTGDRHLMEISRDDTDATPYPMWDFTASGLNEPTKNVREPNRFRVGPVHRTTNFGVVQIDWDADPVTITLDGRDGENNVLTKRTVELNALRVKR